LHQKHFHLFHDFNSNFEASSRETTIASLAKIPVGHNTVLRFTAKSNDA
jgi:hypothetical protein